MVFDPNSLKTALPYIRAFHDRVFVIKFGGSLCEPGEALRHISEQISILYHIGIKLVVVHGGGKSASDLCSKLGIETRFIAGRRVTSLQALEALKMSFGGVINTDVISALESQGVRAVGLSGVDGGLIEARRRPPVKIEENGRTTTVDYGYVGDITSIKKEVLVHLLNGDFVPVVCSLGRDENGQVLNINADFVAAEIAISLEAEKYILLTTVGGVLKDPDNPESILTVAKREDILRLIDDGKIRDGMLPKMQSCLDALSRGVRRVHVVSGVKQDSLLTEIFTNEGSGTLVTQ